LSDGGDNASHRRLDDVLHTARRSSATIYTIGIYDDADLDRNPSVLRKIAELSGGHVYLPNSLHDLEQVWKDIAGRIRHQYTIGYHSSNAAHDGRFRNVRITAGRNGGQGLRVTTRDGYLAPADKSISK
jgi:Ca-activated chloride channel homolog